MHRGTRAKRYEVPVWAHDRRPNLGICGDQGGSGLPAWVFMLSSLRVRGILCFDRFHSASRDWKLSLQDSEWWPIVLEMQVVLNLAHGPWLSESWFIQICEGFESHSQSGHGQDPKGGIVSCRSASVALLRCFLKLCVTGGVHPQRMIGRHWQVEVGAPHAQRRTSCSARCMARSARTGASPTPTRPSVARSTWR